MIEHLREAIRPTNLYGRCRDVSKEAVIDHIVVGAVEKVDCVGAEVSKLALVESNPFRIGQHDIRHL